MNQNALRGLALLLLLALGACVSVQDRPDAFADVSVVVRDVFIVDVGTESLIPNQTVLVSGERIVWVGSATTAPPSPGAEVIDGAGRFLIPGLWDMHVHALWSEEAMRTFLPLFVANGVTGVRDMGGIVPVMDMARREDAAGTLLAPRIVAAGSILDGPEPVQAEISIPVSSAEAGAEAVRTVAAAGADFIKVYTLLPRAAYFAILDEARERKLAVAGHLPADVTIEEAIEGGQRSIEHLRDEIEPLCRPSDPERCAGLAARLGDGPVWQTPTLGALRKGFYEDPALASDSRLPLMPASLRAEWLAAQAAAVRRGPAYLSEKRARYADEAWTVKFLSDRGAPLLAGTDAGVAFAYPGSGLHDELERLVRAGLSPARALRAATIEPALYLGTSDSQGAVRPGHAADLVLLEANPLERIEATRTIRAVILRGRVIGPEQLRRLGSTTVAQPQ